MNVKISNINKKCIYELFLEDERTLVISVFNNEVNQPSNPYTLGYHDENCKICELPCDGKFVVTPGDCIGFFPNREDIIEYVQECFGVDISEVIK